MSAFIPLKRSCPVCDGARKDCRQSRTTNLIHCRHSEANPIDYVFRGLDRQGFGMWADKAEAEAHSEEQREEWRRQRKLEKQQRLEAERQQRAQLLSESERDRENRKVFGQLSLNQDHRKDLERRGLTDDLIKAGGFKSVEQWQRLDSSVSHRLAGVSIDGRSLITQAGYIWPVKNPKGEILGWQIRKNDNETGRFAWSTSATKKRPNGATVHLPNGELPIACHRPATDQILTDAIELTEGTGVKPFIAAQCLNRITLGAAGGNFASSKETFKSYLDELSEELGTKQLILSPDAGAIANLNVMRAYRETHELTSSWGYKLKFRWWGQLGKDALDIDELTGEEAIAYISPEEFFAIAQPSYTPSTQSIDRTITRDEWELKHGFGKRLRERIKKTLEGFKGFGTPPAPKPVVEKEAPDHLFQDANQRLSAWQRAVRQGYRYILDASAPGLGKSHAAGIALPEAFGAEKLWYLSSDHRNPTTRVIESNYIDLPVRNNGLKFDDSRKTPNGNPFLVWPKLGEEADTKGNCPKTDLFQKFRAKNLKVEASETSPICQTCKLAYPCKKGIGQKYGASFRGDRKNTLEYPKIRAHADSMPSPVDFDYLASGIIWDEIGTQIKVMDSVAVTLPDFNQIWCELEAKAPHLHEQLKPLRLALRPLLTGEVKQPFHGWDDAGIRALVPDKPTNLVAIIGELEEVLEPDLSFLEQSADAVKADAGISKAAQQLINRQLRRQAHEEFSEGFQRIALNWLVPFLKIWAGERGAFRCDRQQLTIFIKSDRHAAVAKSAKFNIFLDGTITRDRLALLLGIDPNAIYVVGQKTPNHNNLRIVHVTGMGKLGKDRRDSLTERVALLKAELKKRFPGVVIGDWQKFTAPGDGQWFVNLRGSNEFQDAPALAVFGNPCQNIGHLQALYQSVTGEYAPLSKEAPHEGLQRFIDAHTEAEIEQALGRLRSHLRPDEQLTFIFVGDYDLSFLGAPIEQIEAFQICPEAGTDAQITRWKILEATKQLHAQGQKLTQEAIATLIGKSQELISKVAKHFGGWVRLRKLLLVLLDPLYSGSNNFESLTEREQDFINGYLSPVIDTTVEAIDTAESQSDVQAEMDVLKTTLKHCVKELGWRKFLQALAFIPAKSQANLLSVVLRAIEPELEEEIAT